MYPTIKDSSVRFWNVLIIYYSKVSIDTNQKWPQHKWRNKFPIRIHKDFLKRFILFSISNDLAYLTVVDQVMPYEEGFKSSANQKWLLKKYFTDSHKSVWNTATGFLHSNCQAFNGQIFDFSRKIASMYYFSNLAYALPLHIVVKSKLSDLKVCTQ